MISMNTTCFRAFALAAILAQAALSASHARAADRGDLDFLMGDPEEIAREWDAMVSARDHSAMWRTATKEQADVFMGANFGAWLADRASGIPADIRPTVAMMAARFNSQAAVPPLLLWLRESGSNQFLRETILHSLGQLRDARAVADISKYLDDKDEWTRFFAAEALSRIKGDWRDPEPYWHGVKGLQAAAVARNINASAYRAFMESEFGGGCESHGLQIHYENGSGGWMARNGPAGFINALSAGPDGAPRFPIVMLHGLIPTEVTPFLSWRLYHYARRGARIIFDQPSYFARFNQMRTMGVVIKSFHYQQGPWDELFPQTLGQDPLFPPVDGLPPKLKKMAFGYHAIGRGGSLIIAPNAISLDGAMQGSFNNIAGWVATLQLPDAGTEALWIRLLTWLAAGTDWQAVTLDWTNEPADGTHHRAGRPIPLSLAATWHAPLKNALITATLKAPDGEIIAKRSSQPMSGNAATRIEADLALVPPLLAETGIYRLNLSASDEEGRVIFGFERALEINGRFDLAVSGFPLTIANGASAEALFTISDTASGVLKDGRLRLRLRDDDRGRSLLPVEADWAGPTGQVTEATLRMDFPDTLPPGQYTIVAEVGDALGRSFARAESPLAVQARYRDRHLFLWSVWDSTMSEARAEAGRKLGLNTVNGQWRHFNGYPYQYAIMNWAISTYGMRLGDYFLEHRNRESWLKASRQSAGNARAVSVNLVEEQGIGNPKDEKHQGVGARRQFRVFLEDQLHTVPALNREIGSDILSWDEIPFVSFGNSILNSLYGYGFRDSILKMRGELLREENPWLHIEPGMGAGLWGSNTYDAMHNRGYVNNLTPFFLQTRLRSLPAYGRAPMTWLVGMHWRPHVWQQGRVVWAAIAAGGRHILNYAPGDSYGANLFKEDHSLSIPGEAYRQVIERVRPYEPVLGIVQNRISDNVCSISWGGDFMTQNDIEPAVDAMFHLGIFPDETSDVARFPLIIDSHSPGSCDTAAMRLAVENGAVLLSTARTRRQLAQSFGVRFGKPAEDVAQTALPTEGDEMIEQETAAREAADQAASKSAALFPLDPLAELIPGIKGSALYGSRGPATGVEPGSGLSFTPGLVFGRIGKGLFIYVNVDSAGTGYFWGDGYRHDLSGWTRLIEAILARQQAGKPPARPIDALGRTDARLFSYMLDTDDGAQQFLLLQANHVLEGSLSGWGMDERIADAIALYKGSEPRLISGPDDSIKLEWTQTAPAAAVAWVRRKADKVPDKPAPAARIILRMNGEIVRPLGVPGKAEDEPVGHLRAAAPSPDFLWEAVGLVLPLEPGRYELELRGIAGRATEVDRIAVMPAAITARVALGDPSIESLHDPRDNKSYPVRVEQGLRVADVPVRPGDAVLLAMLGHDPGRLHIGTKSGEAEAGRPLAVSAALRDAQGRAVPRSAICIAFLVTPDGKAVAGSGQRILLGRGSANFDFWPALSDPRGAVTLRIKDLTTGLHSDLPLTIRDPAPAPPSTGFIRRKDHGAFRLEIAPLPDLRRADLAIFNLSGSVMNSTRTAADVEIVTGIPPDSLVAGPGSTRVRLQPESETQFSIPILLTRAQALAVRERDLCLPVRIRGADGATLAEARPRLMLNSWNASPPRIGTISGGSAELRILNGTAQPVSLDLEIGPSAGITPKPARQVLSIGANESVSARAACPLPDPQPGEGMIFFPYTARVGGSCVIKGEFRVEFSPESDWWLATRDILPKIEADIGAAPAIQADFAAGALRDMIDDMGVETGPWTPPHDIFSASIPPGGWIAARFTGAADFSVLDAPPGFGTLVLAATHIVSPRETDALMKIGREVEDYVWLDGDLVQDRRSSLTKKTGFRAGARGHFTGRVWLNGKHIYGERPEREDQQPPEPVRVKLKKGLNPILVQYAAQADDTDLPARLFVFFYDAETGKRIPDLEFRMPAPPPAGERAKNTNIRMPRLLGESD